MKRYEPSHSSSVILKGLNALGEYYNITVNRHRVDVIQHDMRSHASKPNIHTQHHTKFHSFTAVFGNVYNLDVPGLC